MMFITGLEGVTFIVSFGFLFGRVSTDGSKVKLECKEYRQHRMKNDRGIYMFLICMETAGTSRWSSQEMGR